VSYRFVSYRATVAVIERCSRLPPTTPLIVTVASFVLDTVFILNPTASFGSAPRQGAGFTQLFDLEYDQMDVLDVFR
jgi:hypothetical protein